MIWSLNIYTRIKIQYPFASSELNFTMKLYNDGSYSLDGGMFGELINKVKGIRFE